MADDKPYVSNVPTPEYMRGVEAAMEALKERWRYWDSSVAAGVGRNAELARHEVWRCCEIITARFDLPAYVPTPREPPR